MSREADLNRFYLALDQLRQQKGGFRLLRDSTGKSGWPTKGIYFFFENGEYRKGSDALRVVRVGTHALTDTSKTKLWGRLRSHKGQGSGGGNHRGSIFRKRIGQALLNRAANLGEDLSCLTWGEGSTAPLSIRNGEEFLETEVSKRVGDISVDDAPGKASSRGLLERNCIALLSNYQKIPLDPPSAGWLGLHSEIDTIRDSGLWNTDCVKEPYQPEFLGLLETFVVA